MAFVTFKEDEKKARMKFMLLAIGAAFLFVGAVFFVLDITTTARFYDGMGIQQVLPRFWLFGLFGASSEGTLVGIAISGFQLFAGYMIVAHAEKNPRKSMVWTYVRIATAIVDTYTDINFRSFQFQSINLVASSLIVGILIYNVFSEWALTAGFGMVADNWAYVIPFIAELFKVIDKAIDQTQKLFEKPKEQPKQGGNNNQNPPKPHDQGHQDRRDGGGKHGHDGGGHPMRRPQFSGSQEVPDFLRKRTS